MKKNYALKLSLILILFTFQGTIAQSKKAIKLSNEYLKVANFSIKNLKQPLLKWENQDTLKYEIIGELQYISKKNWDEFITDLEFLTGMKIVETTNKSDAKIIIFFGELNDYFIQTKNDLPLSLDLKFSNWNNRSFNHQFQITKSSYCLVPSKIQKSSYGNFLLKKLFLKSLGILGATENESSMFYEQITTYNQNFKNDDKQIVKLHYNANIKAGMDFQQLKEVLSQSVDLNSLAEEKL